MIYIYAKYGTKEKVLIADQESNKFNQGKSADFQQSLQDKYGGDWLLVDHLYPEKGEVLRFEDDFEYRGFHPKFKRYFTAVDTL